MGWVLEFNFYNHHFELTLKKIEKKRESLASISTLRPSDGWAPFDDKSFGGTGGSIVDRRAIHGGEIDRGHSRTLSGDPSVAVG